MTRRARVAQNLHPLAWWIWALGLAAAVTRTTNPVILLIVVAVLGVTVASRRSEAPWATAFKYYMVMAGVVIAIKVVFRAVFGGDVDDTTAHVLFRLPRVPLPSWAAGVQLGGPVTLEGSLGSLYNGLQLGCLLACLGAANALANAKRALRLLPGALYELGAAVVVALSVAPQLIESVQRVRKARRLRGDTATGRGLMRTVAIPVLEDALERSMHLAASMDGRGYGRTGSIPARERRATAALTLAGMVGRCVGSYGLFDGSALTAATAPGLAGGAVLCVCGLVLGSRRVVRTRYRPDPWKLPEWIVAGSGMVAAVLVLSGASGAAGLNPSVNPLQWPALPAVALLAVLLPAVAAVAAPPPVRSIPVGHPSRRPAGPTGVGLGQGELSPAAREVAV